MHPLLIDLLALASEGIPGFAVAPPASARREAMQPLAQIGVLVGTGLIMQAGTGQVYEHASPPLLDASIHQKAHVLAFLIAGGYFFESNSRKASTSRSRSASRRLRRLFSRSNSLRRCASERLMPPYIFRHR